MEGVGEAGADKKRTRDEDVEESRQVKGKQEPVRCVGTDRRALNGGWRVEHSRRMLLARSMPYRANG